MALCQSATFKHRALEESLEGQVPVKALGIEGQGGHEEDEGR